MSRIKSKKFKHVSLQHMNKPGKIPAAKDCLIPQRLGKFKFSNFVSTFDRAFILDVCCKSDESTGR